MSAAAETRRLLALAWPVMLTSLNWTLLQVTDVALVGLTGADQVAALAAARAVAYPAIVAGLAWLSGVLVFAARADGAGDPRRTGAVLHAGLRLATVLGLAGCLLLFVGATAWLRLVGVAPALVRPAAAVARVMALSYPPAMLSLAFSYFLEGISRPRRVTAVNLATLPVNALLAWAWSGGHWGLPRDGAWGAAAATSVVTALVAAAMAGAAWFLPDADRRGVRRRDSERRLGAAALARFGVMPALSSGLEWGGFSVLIALSTRLGGVAAHAFQLVFALHNIAFGAALGFGSAAGVRVGNAVGEGRPEVVRGRASIAAGLSAAALGAAALAVAVAARPLAGAFPAGSTVRALAAAMLPRWAPFVPFDAAQVVFLYALRSLGDQVAAGVNAIVAYFLVTGGVGLALVSAGAGPMALVWAAGSGMVAAAALHGTRFAIVSARVRRRS